ncbi:Na+/H+ antiporter subunit E [Halorarius halobius]|uniref:Na+/H+ antiporter subunit E n=1 Tax=Halorarius halobius TaxID=2962671 RepID=UPI0020CC7687|nr:Na+/H+ antiporter subunit E [Halorarius halobius]
MSTDTDPLVHGGGPRRFLAVFLGAYGFYLLLGDPFDPFDLATGAVTAAVVAAAFAPLLFAAPPTARRTLPRLARAALFVPYLLYEVAKANLAVAYVVLHPDLPVDPAFVTFDPDGETAFERAMLANAITLTPGTVTVEADADRVLVHSLTPASRERLAGGPLERAVRFVVRGRGS